MFQNERELKFDNFLRYQFGLRDWIGVQSFTIITARFYLDWFLQSTSSTA